MDDRVKPPDEPGETASARWEQLIEFLRRSADGGVLLVGAAIIALIWSNSPAASSYETLLHVPLGILSLHGWVNDFLMALFFLLVGLEIRHEMTGGQLASVRKAAAPGLAALGGMVAPALIYVAFNYANASALKGWAVPCATDIAFALAALNLLGDRVPISLKVFLTALAIIDDIGAIIIIAIFYTGGLNWLALGVAIAVLAALYLLSRAGVRSLLPYLGGGLILWVAIHQSGIHATLAGVALAFVIPMHSQAGEMETPAHRLERRLGGIVSLAILPLFGLFNAGLQFNTISLRTLSDPVFLGIAAGLVLGKQIGVFGVTMLACKLRWIHLPGNMRWPALYGGSLLCGIGFTMSLFIGDLAFAGQTRDAEMKLAVFSASLLSAVIGLAVLRLSAKPGRSSAG